MMMNLQPWLKILTLNWRMTLKKGIMLQDRAVFAAIKSVIIRLRAKRSARRSIKPDNAPQSLAREKNARNAAGETIKSFSNRCSARKGAIANSSDEKGRF